MKKLLLAALVGLSLVASSGRASADQTFGDTTITSITVYSYKIHRTGVRFTTTATHDRGGNPLTCNLYVIGADAPNYNATLSVLLTAFVSQRPVIVTSQPLGTYPEYLDAIRGFDNGTTCVAGDIYLH